jgi:hypothetical protein
MHNNFGESEKWVMGRYLANYREKGVKNISLLWSLRKLEKNETMF